MAHHSFRFQATKEGPRGSPDVRSRTCSSVELTNLRPIMITLAPNLKATMTTLCSSRPRLKQAFILHLLADALFKELHASGQTCTLEFISNFVVVLGLLLAFQRRRQNAKIECHSALNTTTG